MFRILSATFVLWVCLRGTALADVLYTIEELLPLPGYTETRAYALNDSGQVVGYSFQEGAPPYYLTPNLTAATLWDQGTAVSIGAPLGTLQFNAVDINNLGQIVGVSADCLTTCSKPLPDLGLISGLGMGNWATVAPDSLASVPLNSRPDCYLDNMFTAISDTGYILGSPSGISSPNMTTQLCGLDVLAFYESGLTLTDIGYVYDPFVDSVRQWVVVPSCTGDLAGYMYFGQAEVSDQISQSICDLASGELHIKTVNASGQFILNVGDRAFLYTPCSEFPGGGSTEGCFPGPGAFPAPEPATLGLLGIGLAGLALRRRKRAK